MNGYAAPNRPNDEEILKQRFLDQMRNGGDEMVTNKVAEDETEAISEYHRKWGWLQFVFVNLLFALLFLPFLLSCAIDQPFKKVQNVMDAKDENDKIMYFYTMVESNLTEDSIRNMFESKNMTLSPEQETAIKDRVTNQTEKDFHFEESKRIEQELIKHHEYMAKLWAIWFCIGFVQMSCYSALTSYVIHRWNHALIQSKSKYFLVQVFAASTSGVVIALVQKLYTYDTYFEGNYDYFNYGFFISMLFAGQALESALVNRMRLIYKVFMSHHELDSEAKDYFAFAPLHIFFFIFSISLVTPYYFTDFTLELNGYNLVFLPAQFVTFIIYPMKITYYTFKCRKISSKYSDFFTNFRVSFYFMVIGNASIIWFSFDTSYMISAALLQSCFQTAIIIYFCDLIFCIKFLDYKRDVKRKLEDQEKQAKSQMGGSSHSRSCSDSSRISHINIDVVGFFKNR